MNGEVLNTRITTDHFSTKSVQTSNLRQLSTSLGFTLTDNEEKIDEKNQELVTCFKKLCKLNEKSVQNDEVFNRSLYENECLYMNDTHSSYSCYMSPTDDYTNDIKVDTNVTEDSFQITKTGMPDGTSQLFPMFLELKGNAAKSFEGIIQGIDRIRAYANIYTIYKRFIAVCPGGDENDSWIIIMNNDISEKPRRYSLHLCKVNDMNVMVEVIRQVSAKALEDSNYVYNIDAEFIVDVLLKLGINWVDCKIELINQSSSNVYLITVGDGKVIGNNCPRFVLKVNRDRDRYETEIASLFKISDYINEKNLMNNFYAIGVYSRDGNDCNVNNKVRIFDENRDKAFMKEYNHNKNGSKSGCWYLNGEFHHLIKPKNETFAGAIIMNKGKVI